VRAPPLYWYPSPPLLLSERSGEAEFKRRQWMEGGDGPVSISRPSRSGCMTPNTVKSPSARQGLWARLPGRLTAQTQDPSHWAVWRSKFYLRPNYWSVRREHCLYIYIYIYNTGPYGANTVYPPSPPHGYTILVRWGFSRSVVRTQGRGRAGGLSKEHL
jgi:hypothetical protein